MPGSSPGRAGKEPLGVPDPDHLGSGEGEVGERSSAPLIGLMDTCIRGTVLVEIGPAMC